MEIQYTARQTRPCHQFYSLKQLLFNHIHFPHTAINNSNLLTMNQRYNYLHNLLVLRSFIKKKTCFYASEIVDFQFRLKCHGEPFQNKVNWLISLVLPSAIKGFLPSIKFSPTLGIKNAFRIQSRYTVFL
jgi:hypothetical protein